MEQTNHFRGPIIGVDEDVERLMRKLETSGFFVKDLLPFERDHIRRQIAEMVFDLIQSDRHRYGRKNETLAYISTLLNNSEN